MTTERSFSLGRRGEAEWQRLRAAYVLSRQSGVIAIVASDSRDVRAEVRRRLEAMAPRLTIIEPGKGDPLIITEAGIAAVGHVAPLPTGTALLDFWLAKVGKPGSMPFDILHTLAEATRIGLTLSPAEVAERTGRSATGGGFQNAYTTLRGHGLLQGQQLDPEFAAAIGVA